MFGEPFVLFIELKLETRIPKSTSIALKYDFLVIVGLIYPAS